MALSTYRTWRRHLLAYCASQTDDSGSSLADHLLDTDMGGGAAGAPPMPAGATADDRKMQRLRNTRARESYSIIYAHITNDDARSALHSNYFQQGHNALVALDALYDSAPQPSELRALDRIWDDLSIIGEVGISEQSIRAFLLRLQHVNGERPVAHRKTNDQVAEKMLESIASASRHFAEGATNEFNLP